MQSLISFFDPFSLLKITPLPLPPHSHSPSVLHSVYHYFFLRGSNTIFSFLSCYAVLYTLSPFPLCFIYNIATLLHECKNLFNVIIFLAFQSISWSSFFVQSKIPLMYLTHHTYSLSIHARTDLQINFTLLVYSFPMLSFISLFITFSSWSTLPDQTLSQSGKSIPSLPLASLFLVLAQQ